MQKTVFIINFIAQQKGKLCFLDGVLDITNKKFIIWENVDFEYYSCVQIQRNFKEYFENPDRKI